MTDEIIDIVSNISVPGFFVTVIVNKEGKDMPGDLEAFIRNKYRSIQEGSTARKFGYNENGWRMIFTFFPTDRVVDEKYALKNKVTQRKIKID